MRSLRRRLVIVVATTVAIGFAATALLAWRIVTDAATRDFDGRLSIALTELAAATDLDADGIVSLARNPGNPLFGQPRSGWYWSIARGEATVARSRSLLLADLPLPQGEGVGDAPAMAVRGPDGVWLRVKYRWIAVRDGNDRLVAAAAGPASLIAAEVRASMRPLLAAMAVVGAIMVLVVVVEISHGLRPLRRLAVDIDRAARGQIAQLPSSSYRELVPLSQGVNDLIGQVETTIGRARAQVGNLAHAIKTPLSVISARNVSRRDDDIAASVESIKGQIDHHLKRARFAAKTGLAAERVPVGSVVDDIVLVMRRSHHARNLSFATTIDPDAAFHGEREDLEELLGNLVDNACKWARTRVAISSHAVGGRLNVSVEDDGPGVPGELRHDILKRGKRLDESTSGAGLGLAIVDDLTKAYGGALNFHESPGGGLRAELDLPAECGPESSS